MTDAERLLWRHLRLCQIQGCRFRRQVPIGHYIADFVCYEKRLIVEVDGGQHLESATDKARTDWLQAQGFRVLRFWNHEVLAEIEAVKESIFRVLSTPHLNPPPQGGRRTTARAKPQGAVPSPLAGEGGEGLLANSPSPKQCEGDVDGGSN